MSTASFGDLKIFVLSQTDSCAYFDAVAEGGTANLITPNISAGGWDKKGILTDAYYKNIFPAGCNINILSIGFRMPHGFEFEHHVDAVKFYTIAHIGYIDEDEKTVRKDLEKIIMPLENYELNFPIYRSLGSMAKKFVMFAHFPDQVINGYTPKILMLNVPDAFVGKRFYVPIFMKIAVNYYPDGIV